MIDFDSIRAANPIPGYLMARGVTLHRSGGAWIGKCPLHDERNGWAFAVNGDRWKCYGKCDAHGDILDLVQAMEGCDRQEALTRLGVQQGEQTHQRLSKRRSVPPRKPQRRPVTPEDISMMTSACARLYQDKKLQTYLSEARGWKQATIEALTVEHALGWLDEWTFHRDDLSTWTVHNALAFIFPHEAMKIRWSASGDHPLKGNARRFAWIVGGPDQMWRSQLDEFQRSTSVTITEGETDAITLMDSKALDGMPVAIPSASIWGSTWTPQFRGKDVCLAFDDDEAGQKATQRVGVALQPFAKTLNVAS